MKDVSGDREEMQKKQVSSLSGVHLDTEIDDEMPQDESSVALQNTLAEIDAKYEGDLVQPEQK